MKQNKLFAVIGEIGSGKSYLVNLLRQHGENVINSDEVNRDLLTDPEYLNLLRAKFPQCFNGDNLDKIKLKDLIFSSKNARENINEISHPIIMNKIFEIARTMQGNIFVEISAPDEKNLSKFDHVILVKSEANIRQDRILKRDGDNLKLTKQMMEVQNASIKKVEYLADFVIENNNKNDKLDFFVSFVTKLDKKNH